MTHEEWNIRHFEIKKLQDERMEKFYSWIKNLITLSVGLFGILISFKSDLPMSVEKSILFVISLTSLGLGILFALVVLYSEVYILGRLRDTLVNYTVKEFEGQKGGINFEQINASRFYRVSKNLFVLFYLISLFSLIGYSTYDLVKNWF
jgi:hypothetical protein